MLLLNMSRVQRTVVLDLRKVLLRFSDPEKLCLKYTDFSTLPTYQLSCEERLIISKVTKEYIGTQRIPSIDEKSRW